MKAIKSTFLLCFFKRKKGVFGRKRALFLFEGMEKLYQINTGLLAVGVWRRVAKGV